MNKLEIMRQTSIDTLIREVIKHQPGITSDKLRNVAKEWDHRLLGVDFDAALGQLHGEFRVTNQKWYPKGHVGERTPHTGKKEDPRQTRMDW